MGNEVTKIDDGSEQYVEHVKETFGVDVSKLKAGVALLMFCSQTGATCLHYGPDDSLSQEAVDEMDSLAGLMSAFLHKLEHDPTFAPELLEYASEHVDQLDGVVEDGAGWEEFDGVDDVPTPGKKQLH